MYKTFSIKTLGCKLNQYDSAEIAGRFIDNGWLPVQFGEKSDIVIVNTCAVTDKSEKKCRSYIKQAVKFSENGKVIVTGCMADASKEKTSEIMGISGIFNNSEKDLIFNSAAGGEIFNPDSKPLPFNHTRAFVKIQDGCDGECAYCIVPSVRGKAVSRKYADIMDHARKIIDSGCPEIVLTGITIGGYNDSGKNLSDLAEDLASLNGTFRIRITSIEPNHVDDRLIDVYRMDKICSHIHLPLQSGSDRILELMKRPYNKAGYLKIIDKIKKVHPEIAVGTDIMVGFPGENEIDFNETLDTASKSGYSYIHQFTFSKRSGTAAAGMDYGAVTEVINERSSVLRNLAAELSGEYRKKFTGKILEGVIEKGNSGYMATTGNYLKINLKKPEKNPAGGIYPVIITELKGNKIIGELAE
jgi:threonylcarbamoyladenosine tRNA methylthiotransferase MtaB